ncbi:MAG: hypothetical protein A3B38_01950 [Candidatus Levybacteria bacterium RIFCSPLOWO2_01_FULL_36_13]|nr:MAG: hypothetical protein A2684_03185 [Candidatus Levybacteria bacterium RIFCSPHIGHO2_01_FULL_36_15b]OGH35625.1 MAG: hypothetical protein A3B38_01950 [Candidatus Levybacteria bacterium RIFCSPLOWO2_01_FULL_36_13]
MLIGIDCRLWNQTGVGRYTRNLIINLQMLDKKNNYVLFVRSEDYEDVKLQISNSKFKISNCDIPWHSLEEQINFPQIINKENLDLMHFPYFSVPYFYKKPYIVTIHDLIVNKFNTGKASTLPIFLYWIKRVGYRFILSNVLKNAKKIIVPSETVKSNILENYHWVKKEKIIITYEGGFEYEANTEFPFKGKYFLRVGNFYPHKNVDILLLAFREFVKDYPQVKLALVGRKDFFYKRVIEKVEQLNLGKNVVFIENPDDKKLYSLYKNSVATIVPSFMEGFSLTAVEAMAAGSPLILSDIPVHREICKDSAIYFDPKKPKDLTLILKLILNDLKTRKDLKEKGFLVVRKFSWEKMAKETLKAYTSANSA